ncbi:YbaY family lipoprotein [Sphingopyxis sp. MWB1]|uniref:YbaY family lipoprotein n=1 Tax=Sphingopyxis sp. MWB1 TaxID=1537715 RepID=UPI00051A1B6E|nr:YbaY family lipoprotein [Sphingopyxis sp. MWB1]
MVRLTQTLALGLAALSTSACATFPSAQQPVQVMGEISYRERIALPPTAQIEIRVDDVSRMDAPARTLARQAFTANGRQVPFAFSLTVDKGEIDPRGRYTLSARITDASGRLMFITDTHNDVQFDSRKLVDMGMVTLVKTR